MLMAGCTGLDRREPMSAGWKAHSEQLAALTRWTASGKLAVVTADTSESARMVWQQHDRDTSLQLSGPLGVGATTIHSNGKQLEIRQGDEHTTLDISTPEAIAMNLGWDLPLPALRHWLKGLPSPDSDLQKFELNAQTDLLQYLQQDGWEIRFEQYARFQELTLPTRLQIQRGATRAKVVISNWQTTSR